MAATGPPPAPPLTYQEHYAQLPDVLQGDYAPLFSIHDTTTGQTSNTIYKTVFDASDSIPKVFLALVLTDGGDYNVIALHNLWRYRPSMVAAAPQWDGKAFAFLGDIHPTSRFIRTVFATKLVATRDIIPVPHRYVHLAMSQLPLQPRAAWTTPAATIIADNNATLCAPLLDWLRVATTKRFDTDGMTAMAPATHLRLLNTVLPSVIDGHQFGERRWAIIVRDIPALNLSASSTTSALATTHYTNFLGVLHRKHAADHAADKARRQADKSNKLPSKTKWQYLAARWMQFTGCHHKADLPPVYLHLANCNNKGDHLLILREAVADCARNHGAATSQIPVISKE